MKSDNRVIQVQQTTENGRVIEKPEGNNGGRSTFCQYTMAIFSPFPALHFFNPLFQGILQSLGFAELSLG